MNEDEQAVVFRQWFGQYTALIRSSIMRSQEKMA